MFKPVFKILTFFSLSFMSLCSCSISGSANNNDAKKIYNFFEINIDNSNIKNGGGIKVAEKNHFSYYSFNKYVLNTEIKPLEQNTYSNLPTFEQLDNSETNYLFGANYDLSGEFSSLMFFKYTFYLKNEMASSLKYKWLLKCEEYGKDSSLLSVIRIMVFDNSNEEEHQYSVYANASRTSHLGEDGQTNNDELISTPEHGYARQFESNDTLISNVVENFDSGEVKKYTVVIWIEGEDPECVNSEFQNGFKDISFKININAKEN